MTMYMFISFPILDLNVLRVPQGVDFDVLRQSHCPLINKDPVCVAISLGFNWVSTPILKTSGR